MGQAVGGLSIQGSLGRTRCKRGNKRTLSWAAIAFGLFLSITGTGALALEFGPPSFLSDVPDQYPSRPQVITDGAGNWLAVWHSQDSLGGSIGTDQDILISRSTDNGVNWSAPVALNSNAASDSRADAILR